MIRRSALAGAACALLLATLSHFEPTFFGAEWWPRDRYARLLASRRPADPRILLVVLDDGAAKNLADMYGRPPYPRDAWARVNDELRRGGASVVAYDILFAEENPGFPEGDRAFAASMRGLPVIVASQTLEGNAQSTGPWPLWEVRGAMKSPVAATLPHPMFRTAAGTASMRLAAQSEYSSAVHDYPLVDRVAGGWMPSLALETARMALRAPRVARVERETFIFGDRRVPVDDELEMSVRWNRGRTTNALTYPAVPLDRLILASLQREDGTGDPRELAKFGKQFRGKIVLIGYTAAGLFDLRATPLSARTAGIEIHANALDNLLNADFHRPAPAAIALPLIVLLGAATGAAVGATRRQIVAAIIAIALVATALALGYAALASGWIVPAFAAAASVALAYVAITVMNFIAEQRQTAVLRTTFGRYVSPQILEHVLAHPERVRLGGERRDLTILFSDIRGFTSISEASEPEEVVEMLNEYLTRMVEILLRHRGTLDKFIGDAVMGFWNAPAADPEHARDAVLCAIEMVEETARLRARWEREGKPALRIGIGINTGEAVVGNIGSERVFGYTVIGDAVNLASRLEGKNKDYGTEIIVSEFTHRRMGEGFDTVYLDEVKVKGKDRAVKIYQVKVAEGTS